VNAAPEFMQKTKQPAEVPKFKQLLECMLTEQRLPQLLAQLLLWLQQRPEWLCMDREGEDSAAAAAAVAAAAAAAAAAGSMNAAVLWRECVKCVACITKLIGVLYRPFNFAHFKYGPKFADQLTEALMTTGELPQSDR
jgi:hypothetical protein